MIERSPFATFASATAFALVLNQALIVGPAQAEDAPPAAAPAAGTEAGAQTPTPAEAARAKAAERRAAAEEDRLERYQDLRTRAAEVGVELPETPPWESIEAQMPERQSMNREDFAAERERRQAAREDRWQQMQQQASERSAAMPDASYWEQRRQEMTERFEQYRKTIEAMTDEQREAARAMFGQHGTRARTPYTAMPRSEYGAPYWHPNCHGDGKGYPSMPYYPNPSYDQGPPPPPMRPSN